MFLLVERLDRVLTDAGWTRRAMVSALTLLGLDERMAAHASYEELADIVRVRFITPVATSSELFARMTFNILVGNTDDHARNHAAFWNGDHLTLTPAYDICPQSRVGREASQAMQIHGHERRSQLALCVASANKFLLTGDEAIAIMEAPDRGGSVALGRRLRGSAARRRRSTDAVGPAFLNDLAFEGWKARLVTQSTVFPAPDANARRSDAVAPRSVRQAENPDSPVLRSQPPFSPARDRGHGSVGIRKRRCASLMDRRAAPTHSVCTHRPGSGSRLAGGVTSTTTRHTGRGERPAMGDGTTRHETRTSILEGHHHEPHRGRAGAARPARRRTYGRRYPGLCRALLRTKGEASVVTLARRTLDAFARLDAEGRVAFLEFLRSDLGAEAVALDAGAGTVSGRSSRRRRRPWRWPPNRDARSSCA